MPKTKTMSSFRLGGYLPRIVFLVVVIVLASATLTLAAQRKATYATPKPAPLARPVVVTVPDVKGQVYVFAKGVLEDAGFAWRVGPGAPGYAGYRVVSQSPAGGTRVIDTGAPTVVLHIARNAHYRASGHAAQNESPYPGTAIQLAPAAAAAVVPAKPKAAAKLTAVTTPAAPTAKPAAKPKAKPVAKPKAKPAATPKVTKPAVTPKAKKPAATPAKAPVRTPAFTVAGGKSEPLDEMTLPARAKLLEAWVAAHTAPSQPNVQHWLYQHAWIVAGARFGWWHGAEALDTLIGVDQTVERQWSLGAKSEAEARAARAFVASHSR